MSKPYTVVGYYESTGRTFAFHVEAGTEWEAYTAAAGLLRSDESHSKDATRPRYDDEAMIVEVASEAFFVACVPGHVSVEPPCDESGVVCSVDDYESEDEGGVVDTCKHCDPNGMQLDKGDTCRSCGARG